MSPNAISVIWSSWNWQDYYCGGGYSTGITKTIAIFREEATSTLAGFHEGRLSRWNWNLMLVFVESFSAENLEKKTFEQGENQQLTQPAYDNGPKSNPGHIGGRRALQPLRHPCPPNTFTIGGMRKVHWILDVSLI